MESNLKISVQQAELIQNLIEHISGTKPRNILTLAKLLVEAFPDYAYEGVGFRMIIGEWSSGYSNLSWSKTIPGAQNALESHSQMLSNRITYKAQISGFDVENFITMLKNKTELISGAIYSFALDEEEILSFHFNPDSVETLI